MEIGKHKIWMTTLLTSIVSCLASVNFHRHLLLRMVNKSKPLTKKIDWGQLWTWYSYAIKLSATNYRTIYHPKTNPTTTRKRENHQSPIKIHRTLLFRTLSHYSNKNGRQARSKGNNFTRIYQTPLNNLLTKTFLRRRRCLAHPKNQNKSW